MLTKRILNLSIGCRNLIFSPKLSSIGSSCQVRGFKDHVKPLSNIDYENPRFQYKLHDSTNSSIVLDLLKFNFNDPNLNSSDIVNSLKKLVQLCKQESLPPKQVVYDDFFENLCDLIKSRANSLSLSEALQILDCLCELKVDSSTESISCLLDRINSLLNDASFCDYNKVMQIIQKLPSLPTAQAMKTRLVKKFIYKVSSEFDRDNFEFLVGAFRFACLHIYDREILSAIINALGNAHFESQSPSSILSLMETLNSSTNYLSEWDTILLKAQNALIVNIPKIENSEISRTLKMSSIKVNDNRLDQFYNKTLWDKAIERLISTECSITEGIECLDASITVRHTSKDLLNYLSGQVYVEKEIEGKYISDEILFKMLEGFADLQFKPLCWDMFLSTFKKDEILNYRRQRLIYRAYHLACLGCYEPRMLEKIFESDFDFGTKRYMHHNFLRLYQILKTLPGYNGPWPSQRQVEMFETLIRENIGYPFYTSLLEGLGGPKYIKTNVRTKLYHQIDHVVAFQPGGSPVAINTIQNERNIENRAEPMEYLENLIVPENCQVVAIMSTPTPWYARNTNQLLGKYATYYDTLETLSCQVVTVCGKEWKSVPKNEKTTFLMDLIRNKLKINER